MLRHALILLAACGDSNDATPDGAAAVDSGPPDGVIAIPLTSLGQAAYTGQVAIGGQPFTAIIDTGSSTLAVAGSTCTNCGVTPSYAPGASAADQHKTASAQYGDGSKWTGEVFTDGVQLGGAANVNVAFASINSGAGFFRSLTGAGPAEYQGILGLGPDGALLAGTTSYADATFAAGTASVFAFHNCPDKGTMWIGGFDASAMASPAAVTPMVSGFPYWAVSVGAMTLGGAPIASGSALGSAIIDTGTTISLIPTAAYNTLTTAIQASAGYKTVFGTQSLTDTSTMGCVNTTMTGAQIDAALPPLQITFPDASGNNSAPVDLPATKAYLLYEGDNTWCYAMADSKQVTGGAPITISLFGESLLNSWIAVFDIGKKQMQFALQKGCAEAGDTPHAAVRMSPGRPWWQQDPRVRVPMR